MSKRAERRRAHKRLVLRAVGKEYARIMELAKPKNVLYCSVCHGRLRLKLLPDYECRKCGRTYNMSEPPLPPEVNDAAMEMPRMQALDNGNANALEMQGMPG